MLKLGNQNFGTFFSCEKFEYSNSGKRKRIFWDWIRQSLCFGVVFKFALLVNSYSLTLYQINLIKSINFKLANIFPKYYPINKKQLISQKTNLKLLIKNHDTSTKTPHYSWSFGSLRRFFSNNTNEFSLHIVYI